MIAILRWLELGWPLHALGFDVLTAEEKADVELVRALLSRMNSAAVRRPGFGLFTSLIEFSWGSTRMTLGDGWATVAVDDVHAARVRFWMVPGAWAAYTANLEVLEALEERAKQRTKVDARAAALRGTADV